MNSKRFLSTLLAMVMVMCCLFGTVSAEVVKTDLVVAMPEDHESFNTIETSALATIAINNLIYLRLYKEDANGQPEAWLADSLNVISDNEVQITIKEGATFSDGTAITIDDVVFCLNRAKSSPMFNTLMATVESFSAVDEKTLSVHTTAPTPSIALALSHGGTGIMPKSYIEKADASGDWSTPITSGPYSVESKAVGESVKIVKNDTFFDAATAAKNTSLTFKNVPEASSRTIMVETGEADVNYLLAASDYKRSKENPKLAVHEKTGILVRYIGADVTVAPFDNPVVRQALNYAIDRESVLIVVAEGLGVPAYTVLPPTTIGYLENPSNYSYDPAKAMELLAQAGYPNGFDTTLVAFTDLDKRVCDIVQPFLQGVGINAEIEVYDTSVRMDMLANHEAPLFSSGWGAMADADLVLPRLFTEKAIGAMNFTSFTHPDMDGILAKGRGSYDVAERTAAYEEAVTLLAKEAAWTPLYIPSLLVLTTAELQGVELSGEYILNLQNLHY